MEAYREQLAAQLEREYALLEKLPGYHKLTERQQNIIRGSLLVQKWGDIAPTVPESEVGTYQSARKYTDMFFCCAAVAALERGADLAFDQMLAVPSEFYKAEYEQVPDFAALDRKVADSGFPCVVLVGNGNPMTAELIEGEPRDLVHHACVALGRNANGDIIVWEKEGGEAKFPFQLPTLRSVYEAYEDSRTHWAIRFLRELKD